MLAVAAQAWGRAGTSAADSSPLLPTSTPRQMPFLTLPSPGGYGFITRSQKTLRTGRNKAVLRAGLARDGVLPPQVRSDSAQRGKCSFCYPTGRVSEFPIFLKMALVGLKGIAQIHFSMKTSFSQKKKKKKPFGSGSVQNVVIRGGLWRD